MLKDKYLLNLETEYVRKNGFFPTIGNLSDYIYERKEIGKEYIKTLGDLGLFENKIIAELDKGCLDTIFNFIDNKEEHILIEISENAYTFTEKKLNTINGHIILNESNELYLPYSNFQLELGIIIDSFMKEGFLNVNDFRTYAKMYSDGKDLYVGCYGQNKERDRTENLAKLKYLKEMVKELSNVELELIEKNTKENYQYVLHKPKKI